MNFEIIRKELGENVLIASEVCDILKISRQQLLNYASQGKLEPFKVTAKSSLYYKPEVLSFLERRNKELLQNNPPIYGDGYTDKALEKLALLLPDLKVVTCVHVYFDKLDAAHDFFFSSDDAFVENRLLNVSMPTFVVQLENDEFLYFTGLNCGYGGQGPCSTAAVLDQMGVRAPGITSYDNLEKVVTSERCLHFRKNDSSWEMEHSEGIVQISEKNGLSDYYPYDIFLFNSKPVLLQRISNNARPDHEKERALRYYDAYRAFLDDVMQVTIYSKEEAIESGHYLSNRYESVIYNVVIQDKVGRQIWLHIPFNESKLIRSNEELDKFLDHVNAPVELKGVSSTISEWVMNLLSNR